jgi:hypothetical protein
MQDTTTKQYQCRHIFTDGRRCASPCLRHEEFCYYHHTSRRPVADPQQRQGRRSTFDLPTPEDRSAIQSAIGEVLRRIASNDIDPRRAGLLLYGLQIASLNLPKTQPSRSTGRSRYNDDISEDTFVEEVIVDAELGAVAPRAEFGKSEQRLSAVAQLLKDMAEMEKEESSANLSSDTEPNPPFTLSASTEPSTEATVLPVLQAAATTFHKARHPSQRRHNRRRKTAITHSSCLSSHRDLQQQPGIWCDHRGALVYGSIFQLGLNRYRSWMFHSSWPR